MEPITETPQDQTPVGPQPTQTNFGTSFTLIIHHDYKHEWEQVEKDYIPQPGDVMGWNSQGKKARKVRNAESNVSWCKFHPYSIQQIHDDRHTARLVKQDHMAACEGVCDEPDQHLPLPKKPDLEIIFDHVKDAVLAELTDYEALQYFECPEYPQISTFLNLAYGLTPPPTFVDQPTDTNNGGEL